MYQNISLTWNLLKSHPGRLCDRGKTEKDSKTNHETVDQKQLKHEKI